MVDDEGEIGAQTLDDGRSPTPRVNQVLVQERSQVHGRSGTGGGRQGVEQQVATELGSGVDGSSQLVHGEDAVP